MIKNLIIVGICLSLSLNSIAQSDEQKIDTIDVAIEQDVLEGDNIVDSLLLEKQKLLQIINPTDSILISSMKNYDILISRDWQVRVVKVKNITDDKIEFLYPLNTEKLSAKREETSQILYANGRRELFYPLEKVNPYDSVGIARVIVYDEKAWENITVVEKIEEIPADLVFLNEVDIRFDGDRINTPNKTLENSSLIILRKKAVNVGGGHLLITTKKFNRPYGDYPSVVMEGRVYGNNIQEE